MTPQNQERIRYLMLQINALEQLMAAAQSEIDGIMSRQWDEEYEANREKEPWDEPREPWELEGEGWKD